VKLLHHWRWLKQQQASCQTGGTFLLLVSQPLLGSEEKTALCEVVDSGWITMGEKVREFEAAFAALHEAEDSVAVASCTAALHLILHALNIGPGDEVLVPSLTFVATANCVLYVGADPVFVDIESVDVPLLSLEDAEAKCTSRTKAVILMHYAGYLANRDAWQAFARRKGVLLIEDAAHAPGNVEVGSYGVAAAFSFYGNKNMTTAEGGAVIASDRALLEKIRQMRGHGMTSGTRQRFASRNPNYDVTMLGFNYRMDELRAAVGLAQLKKLHRWNDTRSRLAERYRRLIGEHCPSVSVPFSQTRISTHHIMPILLPDPGMRTAVIDQLGDFGVQTTIHYPPVHRLSFLQERCKDTVLPLTEEFARRELTLPLHPKLEGDMVETIVERLATLVHSPQKILAAE
jgi:dTDP-4-amino-4,6-dideoxygalactose transaminase